MVDLMNLLSDVLIGSFQMLMLNDLGKNMFPYRIKTCWTRILIYGVTALVILGVNHIESTFINIMMVPVSYTIASIVIFQGSVRSEERRVGKECRIGCRSRWSPYH